ncbi:MAG: hypothetical protein M3340_13580, partial [Actinomycetota bacterium]|nr:hypothetical protein [Actinomycetota bacterium]
PAAGAEPGGPGQGAEPSPGPGALAARWEGPLNLRALLGDLPPATRAIAADPGNHAVLLNLALRTDGGATREEIAAATSYALRRPVDPGLAARLLDALVESGWVAEVS